MLTRFPEALFFSFVVPLLISVALASAFRQPDVAAVTVGVLESAGSQSPAWRDRLAALPAVTVLPVSNVDTALVQLRTHGLDALATSPAPEGWHFDASRPEGKLAFAALHQATLDPQAGSTWSDVMTRTQSERSARYIDFLIPGLLAFQLMSSALFGMASAIVELRAGKVLKRMLATPMRHSHLLLGLLVAQASLSLLETTVFLGFARFAFGTPIAGNFFVIAGIGIAVSMTFGSLAFALASRAETHDAVNGLTSLVNFPMMLLSGIFFSSERFPEWSQPVLRVLPLRAAADAIRSLVLEGGAVVQTTQFLWQAVVLVAWMVGAFLVGVRLFRWA